MTLLTEGAKGKLILISAPAGSGKTTLLSDWIHWSGLPAAWLSLDQTDDDPVRFFTYVTTALQTIQIDFGRLALSALKSPKPPPFEMVMTNLINEIAVVEEEVVLILDDYHVLRAPRIHETMEFLVDQLPSQLHLVIASRADPPLPLARLRARGELTEIRAGELSFTADETTAFIQSGMGLPLSPEDIQKLVARTEGCIAGLPFTRREISFAGCCRVYTLPAVILFNHWFV